MEKIFIELITNVIPFNVFCFNSDMRRFFEYPRDWNDLKKTLHSEKYKIKIIPTIYGPYEKEQVGIRILKDEEEEPKVLYIDLKPEFNNIKLYNLNYMRNDFGITQKLQLTATDCSYIESKDSFEST